MKHLVTERIKGNLGSTDGSFKSKNSESEIENRANKNYYWKE